MQRAIWRSVHTHTIERFLQTTRVLWKPFCAARGSLCADHFGKFMKYAFKVCAEIVSRERRTMLANSTANTAVKYSQTCKLPLCGLIIYVTRFTQTNCFLLQRKAPNPQQEGRNRNPRVKEQCYKRHGRSRGAKRNKRKVRCAVQRIKKNVPCIKHAWSLSYLIENARTVGRPNS